MEEGFVQEELVLLSYFKALLQALLTSAIRSNWCRGILLNQIGCVLSRGEKLSQSAFQIHIIHSTRAALILNLPVYEASEPL